MRKRRVESVLFVICLAISVYSAIYLLSYIWNGRAEERKFAALEQMVNETMEASEELSATGQPEPKILPEYRKLHKQNPDFWGWIKIDGISFSYPVMYTPKEPEYYLNRDFEGNISQSGVPFLDENCFEDCGNYLIHGHNMKNGSMFAVLLSYRKEDFYKEHPMIQFDTLSEHHGYSIIAAFYSKVYESNEENGFRYYQYTDLTERELFDDYIRQVRDAALYEIDTEVQFGEQLLTLSTCSYHTDQGRFVVVAKKGNMLP